MEKLSELGSEVLEVGCGVGGNVNLLSSTTRYLGIDMHLPAVDYCKEKYPQQSFRCSRIEDLPSEVKVRNFDSIFFLDVLEHLDQDVLVLRESSNFLNFCKSEDLTFINDFFIKSVMVLKSE